MIGKGNYHFLSSQVEKKTEQQPYQSEDDAFDFSSYAKSEKTQQNPTPVYQQATEVKPSPTFN